MDEKLRARIEAIVGKTETPPNFIELRLELDKFISQAKPYTTDDIKRMQEILHKFGYGDAVGDIDGQMGPKTAGALLTYTAEDSIVFRNGQIGMAFVNSAIAKAPSDSVVRFQRALALNPYKPRIASHIAVTTPFKEKGHPEGTTYDKAQLATFNAAGIAPMASPVSDRITASVDERNRIGFSAQSATRRQRAEVSFKALSQSFSASNISELQSFLNAQGFHSGRADGIIGRNTANASLHFMLANPESFEHVNLKNLETILRKARPEDLVRFRESLRQSPEAYDALKARMAATNDLRGKQTLAALYGFYAVNGIDGQNGPKTRAALKEFEEMKRPVNTGPPALVGTGKPTLIIERALVAS